MIQVMSKVQELFGGTKMSKNKDCEEILTAFRDGADWKGSHSITKSDLQAMEQRIIVAIHEKIFKEDEKLLDALVKRAEALAKRLQALDATT